MRELLITNYTKNFQIKIIWHIDNQNWLKLKETVFHRVSGRECCCIHNQTTITAPKEGIEMAMVL